eukprot:IDg23910t1
MAQDDPLRYNAFSPDSVRTKFPSPIQEQGMHSDPANTVGQDACFSSSEYGILSPSNAIRQIQSPLVPFLSGLLFHRLYLRPEQDGEALSPAHPARKRASDEQRASVC